MMPELREGRRGFELHYCARSAESAAFHDEIRLNYDDDTVHTHFDGGDPAKGCDIAKLLAEARPDTHVYCCGPKGLIEAVRHAAAHWAPSSVHFERFAGNVPVPEDGASPFQIELARSGAVIEVDADETALQALARNGIQIDAGCRSGACGACLVDLLDGTPVHRDVCLTDTERKTRFAPCVSRSQGRLVLDL
jgi:ferredoxin